MTVFATLAGIQASTAAPATAAPTAAAAAHASAAGIAQSGAPAAGTAAPGTAAPASAANNTAPAYAPPLAATLPAYGNSTAAPISAPAFVPGTAAPLRAAMGGTATPPGQTARTAAGSASASGSAATQTSTAAPANAAATAAHLTDGTPAAAPSPAARTVPTDTPAVPEPVQQAADQLLARHSAAAPRPETTFSGAALAAAAAPGAGTAIFAARGDSDGASFTTSLHQLNLGAAIGAAQQQGQPAHVVPLSGEPEQWQQPLRAALGDRLQLQLQRGSDQAVITLDPPNMGRVEIAIRHTQGSLQVAITANNAEVLRQLNTISDNVRQDLSQRNFTDVTVTVASSTRGSAGQNLADGGGRQQQGREQEQRNPGRALSEGDSASSTFAMNRE